ncbi:MAG: polyketide biosynthesis methyltransferase [Desulfobacterales bacterium]|nr:MAG: polyketide biosynthesis methyltransferase [Desulfobacterales bacterium]
MAVTFNDHVQETLCIPLWCRGKAGDRFPEILIDKQAGQIIENMEYDFSSIEKEYEEYGQICCLVRAKLIDDAVHSFLVQHPDAVIVNIGAGLDTTFSRVDNGSLTWFDLDLPEVITLRETLIPSQSQRCTNIAADVLETSWFERISSPEGCRFFCIAGGLFHYFPESEVKMLILKMAERFPQGRIVFDTVSKTALKIANKKINKSGNFGVKMLSSLNRNSVESWSDKIEIEEYTTFFRNIPRNSRWRFSTRMNMNIVDTFKMLRWIQLCFRR